MGALQFDYNGPGCRFYWQVLTRKLDHEVAQSCHSSELRPKSPLTIPLILYPNFAWLEL